MKLPDEDGALGWNADPNTSHEYTIFDSSDVIVKGKASSPTNVFKIKNIKLVLGKTYKVQVGSTKVDVSFFPIQVIRLESSDPKSPDPKVKVICESLPTLLEIISDGSPIPLSKCNLYGVSEGETSFDFPYDNKVTNTIALIYNGPNCVTYVTIEYPNGVPTLSTKVV
jgi:hypothetical protein